MNFFFHTSNDFISSILTIPKFQNSGKKKNDLKLFQANIINNQWDIVLAECTEDDYFWVIKSNDQNQNTIFFLATEQQVDNFRPQKNLCNFNSFTDTSPAYRANLEIKNTSESYSSYQSEYPYFMTQRLGDLYSDCGVLTTHNALRVGVFLRNIYLEPLELETEVFLFDNKTNTILKKFKIELNKTCYIDLTDYKSALSNCYIYIENYLGIPIYLIDYGEKGLSFEHTHPPHESVQGSNKFNLVKKIKARAREKISQATIS